MAEPVLLLATVALIGGLDWASLEFSRAGGDAIAAIWPGDAALLILLLVARGRRAGWFRLAAGVLGGFLAEVAWGDDLLMGALFACANAAGVALVYLGLQRLGAPPRFRRTRHMLSFLVLAGGGALVSGVLGAAVVVARAPGTDFLAVWARWALADWLGYAVLTPLPLLWARKGLAQLSAPGAIGRTVLTLGLYAATTVVVFGQTRYPLLFLAPFGLFVVSYVLGLEGVVLAVLMTVLVAMGFGVTGRGPTFLVQGSQAEQLLALQVFLAIITLSILPISSVMGERRRLRNFLVMARDRARAAASRAQGLATLAGMAEDIAGVGHWRRDLRTGAAIWSAQVFKILGFDPEAPPPSYAALIDAFPPGVGLEVRAAFDACCETGEPGDIQARYVRPSGEERHLALHFACDHDQHGAAALIGLIRDVTDEKRLEAQIREAQRAAEAASARKSDFLADFSHELRTPLASILGFASLLRQRPELAQEDRAYADRISTAGQALLTTVNDILLFSELEAGELEVRPLPASPARMAQEVADLFQAEAEARGLSLQVLLADDLPAAVTVDARRVRQLLLNLVGNAVKFTAAGEVALRVGYSAADAVLSFEVADTGPGIPPERQAHLFDRFSRADPPGRRAHGGAGLGLAISKGLAEAMGGTIEVASAIGKGSVFRVAVAAPVCADETGAAADTAAAVLRPAIRRMLVADDNDANRALIKVILEPLHLEVREARDGLAAVAEAGARPFDLILLDLRMPELDGVGAARAIRAGPGANQRSLIIATSTDHASLSPEALSEAGFDGFMAKPFPPEALIRLALRLPARGLTRA